jgi:predicted  nucleic acid-binding Zn-ribbon protein
MPKIRTDYPFMEDIREDYQLKIKNREIKNKDKVPFWCDIHKEYYWQRLSDHRCDHGCPKCGKVISANKHIRKDYPFMNEIREDYQLLIKNGEILCTDKIPFICDKHGEYWQILHNHSNDNNSCPKCNKINQGINHRRKDYPFMNEIREDYQLKIQNGEIICTDKVPFKCEKHGEYWQLLKEHCHNNCGCPKCGRTKNDVSRTNKYYPFMNEIREDYQLKIQNGEIICTDKIPFICEKHGEYWQNLSNHNRNSCPKCGKNISNPEQEVFNFIKEYYPNTINNIRDLLLDRKLELDIYIPKLKIGIEFDGIIWHSEKFCRDKYNLLNKTIEFNDVGIHVIHIFEDEWLDNKELTKQKLLFVLNNNNYNINEYYQLFGNNNILDLRYFSRNNNPFIINGYISNKILEPNYFYVNNQKRILKDEIIDNNKYYKIFDCGYIEYYK